MAAVVPDVQIPVAESAITRAAALVRPPGIARNQTSVPDISPPDLGAICARRLFVLRFGDADAPIDRIRLTGGGTVIHQAMPALFTSEARTTLVSLTASSKVGDQFLLVGTEDVLFAARAVLLGQGAVPEEIHVIACDGEVTGESGALWIETHARKRIFCAHCHQVTTTTAGVGDAIECGNCRLGLVVKYHYSRRYAAYLGGLIRL